MSDTLPAHVAPADGPARAAAAAAAQRLADAQARLQAWQALGLQRSEPLRLARLQALARRLAQLLQVRGEASASDTAANAPLRRLVAEQARLMGERLDAGLAELAQRLPARTDAAAERREPGPLGRLVQVLDAAAGAGEGLDAGAGASMGTATADRARASAATHAVQATEARATGLAPSGPHELKVLREARSTWARLGAQRQLARSLAQAPANAGPLNSHQLLLRALQQMQQLSPGYLLHFMGYAQTLLDLEHLQQANTAAALPAAAPAKAVSAARALAATPARASRPGAGAGPARPGRARKPKPT